MSDLHACAAKQVVSSPWGAPLLGSPSPFAESHAKDAPCEIPSKFRTSPVGAIPIGHVRPYKSGKFVPTYCPTGAPNISQLRHYNLESLAPCWGWRDCSGRS